MPADRGHVPLGTTTPPTGRGAENRGLVGSMGALVLARLLTLGPVILAFPLGAGRKFKLRLRKVLS